jgi:hypothetical protein
MLNWLMNRHQRNRPLIIWDMAYDQDIPANQRKSQLQYMALRKLFSYM